MALKLEEKKHCLLIRWCLYIKCLLSVNFRAGTGLDIVSSRCILGFFFSADMLILNLHLSTMAFKMQAVV